MAFIDQVDSVFTSIYQNCQNEKIKANVGKIKKIEFELLNAAPTPPNCLKFDEKTGVLTARMHYWDTCKGGMSDQFMAVFSQKK